MSDASDELTLRLNVKFRGGTAPALQAELLKLPGRHRVKRLLELGILGLMAERCIELMDVAYRGQEPAPGQATGGAVTPKPLAAADMSPVANPVAPPAQDPAHVEQVNERSVDFREVRERIEVTAQQGGKEPGRPRRRPGFNIDLSG